ncbi:MAG: ATP-binding protein [Bacillota bacterium]|nr:ATP-binding protein [Bacillota bacterium]
MEEIEQIILYRNILKDSVIKKAYKLLKLYEDNNSDSKKIDKIYYELYSKLIQFSETKKLQGDAWKNYLLSLIAADENIFSLQCEKSVIDKNDTLFNLVKHDSEILNKLYNINLFNKNSELNNVISDYSPVENGNYSSSLENNLSVLNYIFNNFTSADNLSVELMNYYSKYGCGILSKYSAFTWNNEIGLNPVNNPDKITFDDIIGYDDQKKTLMENTEAFVRGKKANNVLLFGDKGTGKSSSVKALLNKYSKDGLRIVEITKEQLINFVDIINSVKNRRQRVIIFIDDLSFEESEIEYKCMKSIIEGRIEEKPDNVIIYCTTNRRHLVKYNFSDRSNDEVNSSDSMQEKLSLSDRFGVTITYSAPTQKEYLKIVEGLAAKNNINIPAEELRQKAIQWELWHNGRSGRAAQQFINNLLGQLE